MNRLFTSQNTSLTRRRLLQVMAGGTLSSALSGLEETGAHAAIDPDPVSGPALSAMGNGYPVKVGVWYTPYWNGEDDPGQWKLEIKLPLLGRYTARNPRIIAQHHRMIKDFGGDFLIFDQTNTIFMDNSRLDKTVRDWYDAMDALPAKERLELCIAFGEGSTSTITRRRFWRRRTIWIKPMPVVPANLRWTARH